MLLLSQVRFIPWMVVGFAEKLQAWMNDTYRLTYLPIQSVDADLRSRLLVSLVVSSVKPPMSIFMTGRSSLW